MPSACRKRRLRALSACEDRAIASRPAPTDLFGQPRGLWVLAGTELWDRISFHGMLAMLVLYMTGDLLVAPARVATIWGWSSYRHAIEGVFGPLSNQALATQTFGLYYAGIAAMPLIGGWLADRLIGRRAAVSAGALLMTLGHFSFAFDRSFLAGLVLLVLGAGLLRGNLPAQVKSLYPEGVPGNASRETTAFQYYYLGINTGAFIAPIVSGAVAAVWGWHAGFAVAGFGMLIGLLVYTLGQRWLPQGPAVRGPRGRRAALTAEERRAAMGLLLVWPIAVCFWIAQAQIWNVYNIWLRDHVAMRVGSFDVPVPWMQSLDGLAPALFIPLVVWIWARQAKRGREPDVFGKMAIGALIFAAGVLILSAGPLVAGAGARAPLALPILFHVVSNFGAMYFTPTALSLYATRAPAQWRGSLVGIYQLSVSAASLITGSMGAMYETMTPSLFWAVNAAICGAGALALLMLTPALRGMLGVAHKEGGSPLPEAGAAAI